MRFKSKGMSGMDGMDAMTFLFTAFRCALLRYTMNENESVSSALSFAAMRLRPVRPRLG